MSDEPKRTTGGFEFLMANVTDAGGALTEEDFFAAMRSAMEYSPAPQPLVVSQATIDRARAAATRLEHEADDLRREIARTRWWRWRRRQRAQAAIIDKLWTALALRRTFG